MRTEDVNEIIEKVKEKLWADRVLDITIFERWLLSAKELQSALQEAEELKHINKHNSEERYRKAKQFKALLEKVKNASQTRRPSYLDDFMRVMAQPPFVTPSTLFQPEGAKMIDISTTFGIRTERAELVLSILYPGSIAYRYGYPTKVRTGGWYQTLTADLTSVHVLSSDPIFYIERDGDFLPVYEPKTLRTTRLRGGAHGFMICTTCLSMQDEDEGCIHRGKIFRTPRSSPIILKAEGKRNEVETKKFGPLLSKIIKGARFLEPYEVKEAVVGFERTVVVGNRGRTVTVDYSPPIGVVIQTSAIGFKLRIDESFIQDAFSNNEMMVRDAIIQIISNRLVEKLRQNNIPIYNHLLVLSSVIEGLELDSIVRTSKLTRRLRDTTFISTTLEAMKRELLFYEGVSIDNNAVRKALEELQSTELNDNAIRQHLRNTLIHTIAHLLLLACCVTSGSQLQDLGYLINDDEIVIFDSVNGGNGSSKMVFDFLTSEERFSVRDYIARESRENIFQPKHLDEAFFELLLPCLGSISNRLFIFSGLSLPDIEVRRRAIELKAKSHTHANAIARLRELGIRNIFPASIGYHAVNYSTDPLEGDRFAEIANICVHGCPECSILGHKCSKGMFREKYSLSKYLQNQYLKYVLSDLIIPLGNDEELMKVLMKEEAAIVKISCSIEDYVAAREKLLDFTAQMTGTPINDGHVRFAGLWVDASFESPLEMCYFGLIVVV